ASFLGAGTVAGATHASPTAAQSSASAAPTADAATALLAVVSEKTGYPVEMLDLDMGLDSDLGIDSIKRVEILSAIQEKLPHAPLIGPEHLGSLQTLGGIASFLGAGATVNATAVAAVSAPAANAGADAATALLAVVSEKTGYPVEMLDLDMGLDSDLGIDSIKRVEILSAIQERLPDAPLIGPEHLGSLQTLGEIAGFLAGNSARAERVMPEPQAIAADIPSSVVEKHQDPHVIKRSGVIAVEMEAATAQPLRLPADREILITDDGSRLPAQLFSQLQGRGCSVRLVRTDDEKEIFSSAILAGLVIIA